MNAKIKLISSMLIFGTIGAFVKNINLASLDIAFLRAVLGCTFLVCTGAAIRQKISPDLIKKNILLLTLSGAAIGFNWIFLFQAYKYTTVSIATLSYYFAPMFVLMLSPLILKERLTPVKISCIIAAMAGLFFILNTDSSLAAASSQPALGILYGLSAAALYASVILMNKFIRNLSGFETTLIQLFIAALVLLPCIVYQGGLSLAVLSGRAVIFVLVVGILHTGIAYFIYFSSMQELNGHSIAMLSYLDPVTAVLVSAVLLGEPFTFQQIIGGILILGAAFFSETGGRLLRSRKSDCTSL